MSRKPDKSNLPAQNLTPEAALLLVHQEGFNKGLQVGIERGFQAGKDAMLKVYEEKVSPLQVASSNLIEAIAEARAIASLIPARLAGKDQIIRPSLKQAACLIQDRYVELKTLLVRIGARLPSDLDNDIMAFHAAIISYQTGEDEAGEQLLQCALMNSRRLQEMHRLISSITFGGRPRDAVLEYLGEQLQALMDEGRTQDAAAICLRDRLMRERRSDPDGMLDFPKDKALELLGDHYAHRQKFIDARKAARDRKLQISDRETGSSNQ